ncbi:MAG TPA: GNAT family N-acetyltransferase [Magnetospirillaceae bacterium]|jgi:GNAT superfamily N-acetyltransferase
MRIRRAMLEDMPTLAALHRHTLHMSLPFLPTLHTPDEDRAWFRDHLFPNNEVWVAEDEAGALLGYAARAQGWLNHIYVHPDHQGRGVGDALLAMAKGGIDTLQLWTFQENAHARRFYEKRGLVLAELTDGLRNEEKSPDARYVWTR